MRPTSTHPQRSMPQRRMARDVGQGAFASIATGCLGATDCFVNLVSKDGLGVRPPAPLGAFRRRLSAILSRSSVSRCFGRRTVCTKRCPRDNCPRAITAPSSVRNIRALVRQPRSSSNMSGVKSWGRSRAGPHPGLFDEGVRPAPDSLDIGACQTTGHKIRGRAAGFSRPREGRWIRLIAPDDREPTACGATIAWGVRR